MRTKRNKLEELAPNGAVATGEFVEECVVKPSFDADGVQATSGIGVSGKEYPDPVPMAAPLGYEPPLGLMDLLQMFVRRSREEDNENGIEETEEEANDFEVGDPEDHLTEYEKVFMPKPAPAAVSGSPVVPPGAQVAAEGGPQPTGAPPKPPESVPKVT